MCFMKEGKFYQADRCIQSGIMPKVIDFFLSIDTFEQKCVVVRGMLQSLWLKYHVQAISIDPSLSNNARYEKKCLINIKILYKQSGKCDNQQQFKDIFEAAMVSTSERFTNNSPISPMTSIPFNKISARKSLCMFTNISEVNEKTYIACSQIGRAI